MKSWLPILLLIAALFFVTQQKKGELTVDQVLIKLESECQSVFAVREKCDPDQINLKVVQETKGSLTSVAQTTNGDFYDLTTGLAIKPVLSDLKPIQVSVWIAWKNKLEANAQTTSADMGMPFGYGFMLFALFIAGIVLLLVVLAPKMWKFLLNRISEISSAVKGNKF